MRYGIEERYKELLKPFSALRAIGILLDVIAAHEPIESGRVC
jgi:hypothetical protein